MTGDRPWRPMLERWERRIGCRLDRKLRAFDPVEEITRRLSPNDQLEARSRPLTSYRSLAGPFTPRWVPPHPAKLPADVHEQVDVVPGSYRERDVVMKAFEGADTVFWLPIGDPTAETAEAAFVDMSRPAAEAIAHHGVRHVVSVSAIGRGWPRDAGHATASIHMDDMLAETGAAFRALACPSLMDNMLRQAALIRDQGVFYWPTPGDFKVPLVATRDVADAAAELLRDRSWGGAASVPLLGPEDLSYNDQARIMSDVLEKTVEFREMSLQDMNAMMLARGASEGMAQAMIDMAAAKNEGLDHMIPRTAENTTPTRFLGWCQSVLKPAVQEGSETVAGH